MNCNSSVKINILSIFWMENANCVLESEREREIKFDFRLNCWCVKICTVDFFYGAINQCHSEDILSLTIISLFLWGNCLSHRVICDGIDSNANDFQAITFLFSLVWIADDVINSLLFSMCQQYFFDHINRVYRNQFFIQSTSRTRNVTHIHQHGKWCKNQ